MRHSSLSVSHATAAREGLLRGIEELGQLVTDVCRLHQEPIVPLIARDDGVPIAAITVAKLRLDVLLLIRRIQNVRVDTEGERGGRNSSQGLVDTTS